MIVSKQGVPQKPVGSSPRWFFFRCVWDMLWGGKFPLGDTDTVKFSWENGVYYAKAAPARGAGGGFGWKWQSPKKEYDPSVAVAGPSGDTYVAVYLSPTNPLCTSGMLDLVSGELVIAPPGIWMAVKSVPAQVTDPTGLPAGTYVNMPQLPYPGSGAVPSGSPLAGDLDGGDVFWVQLEAYDYCANQSI